MKSLPTNQIATMTEMRDPQKVLDQAKGRPVAVLKNSRLVGYFVPAEATQGPEAHRVAALGEVMEHLEASRELARPVLDYLRDK